MFFQKVSNFTARYKWFIIAFWILLTLFILISAPVLSKVANTDSQSFFPSDTDAVKYSKLINQLYPSKSTGTSMFAVLYRKSGINSGDIEFGKKLEDFINKNKAQFKVKSVISPFTNKQMESTMLSKDKQAALIEIDLNVSGYTETANNVVKALREDVQSGTRVDSGIPDIPTGLSVNITGDAAFGQEEIDDVHNSMGLTFKITILLLVLILIIIYKSPVAPVIPLMTIGISFLISRGLIASLTTIGLRVSSFTEQFLVAVLFGAGTDYCLLLISRFREEIVSGKQSKEAMASAFPHTGMAIISSGGTVIIGFLCMVMAKFGLFNTTGPSIAIGVGITILAVLTLPPALIAILGERIFWPAHPSKNIEKEQQGSRFWNKLSVTVTSKPYRFIIICLLVAVPFVICTTKINRDFDQLGELPSKSDAILGFDVMKNHFDQGQMLPVKVVIKADKDLWSNEPLQAVDEIAKNLLKVDGVASVRTATRPLGEQINETTLSGQLAKLSDGFGQLNNGFAPVMDGLDKMHGGVDMAASSASKGGDDLKTLADKTKEVNQGLAALDGSLGKLSSGQQSAISGLDQVNGGIGSISKGMSQTADGVDKAYTTLLDTKGKLDEVLKQEPDLASNISFQTAYAEIKQLTMNLPALSQGIKQVESGITGTKSGIDNTGTGLQSIKNGLDQCVLSLQKLINGLNLINDNQVKAGDSLKQASASLLEISGGLGTSRDALDKMKSGVDNTKNATQGYISGKSNLSSMFYLPDGTLEQYPELRNAMSNYISPDGKGILFYVVLSNSPYSTQALNTIDNIKAAVSFSIKGTVLDKSDFKVGGSTAVYNELRQMTADDFIKVLFVVLLGIFIVLMLLLRSITAPLYLIFTILLSFASTMGISYLVFQVLLGEAGLSWSVPFFSFCILVALGVDYNIFLMSRVKEEYSPGGMTQGTQRALASTGKIITSCGIIMAGTFGAMILSPVTMLVQIGFTTVVGLLMDTFIIRCLMVPAIAVKFGELNWWPGRKVRVVSVETEKKSTSTSGQFTTQA
ncbi:MAG: MMPL family transporter [Bacillota bacterium]|nr:MMPL family transporter [Bacillota bacterium]